MPGPPLPAIRTRWPSDTPAGIFASIVWGGPLVGVIWMRRVVPENASSRVSVVG